MGITDYGILQLKSENSNPSSPEGSQISFHGMGGDTGKGQDYLCLDANNGDIRIFGNFGGGDIVKVYAFTMMGYILMAKK